MLLITLKWLLLYILEKLPSVRIKFTDRQKRFLSNKGYQNQMAVIYKTKIYFRIKIINGKSRLSVRLKTRKYVWGNLVTLL